jgi:excisionase family DNA binding protein
MDISFSPQTQELLEKRSSLTVAETAAVLSVSRGTVYNRIADGTIQAVRIGHRVVVPTAGIRALLAEV